MGLRGIILALLLAIVALGAAAVASYAGASPAPAALAGYCVFAACSIAYLGVLLAAGRRDRDE